MSEPLMNHHRVGPGKCACGFDAYRLDGIMIDYHEELQAHMRQAEVYASQVRTAENVAKREQKAALDKVEGGSRDDV